MNNQKKLKKIFILIFIFFLSYQSKIYAEYPSTYDQTPEKSLNDTLLLVTMRSPQAINLVLSKFFNNNQIIISLTQFPKMVEQQPKKFSQILQYLIKYVRQTHPNFTISYEDLRFFFKISQTAQRFNPHFSYQCPEDDVYTQAIENLTKIINRQLSLINLLLPFEPEI